MWILKQLGLALFAFLSRSRHIAVSNQSPPGNCGAQAEPLVIVIDNVTFKKPHASTDGRTSSLKQRYSMLSAGWYDQESSAYCHVTC